MAETKNDSGTIKLYKKILDVRKSVDYLQKSTEGQQYKYTSSSQVLSAVRAKMNEVGLLLVSRVTGYNLIQYLNSKEVMVNFTELEMEMEWIDADTGVGVTVPWYGQGVDLAGEKGVGKALTYAEKYFMLKQFNIPTDKDDPDAHQEKNASAEDLKAAQDARKKQLIASLGKCTKLDQVTKIWVGNPDLKKDADFAAAVKNAGGKLKKKETPKEEPESETETPKDEQPK